jgi:hypothetical protein
MTTTLYRVIDQESGTAFLIEERDVEDYEEPEYAIDRAPVLNSEELADWCDREAENANYHRMVGAHMWLSGILVKEAGEDVATKVMRAIADVGGLHEGVF